MAQKKKTASSKASSSTGKKKPANKSTKKVEERTPYRREVGAFVCVLLAIFSVFGYFESDGWLINLFANLIKGLIGYGYYIFPVAILYGAAVLGFHRGRPVIFRFVSSLLVPLIFGILFQLLFSGEDFDFTGAVIKNLWVSGLALKSAGVVGGLLVLLFSRLLGVACAGIVLFIVLIFFLFAALNLTPSMIIEKIKNRPQYEYIEEEEEPEPRQPKPGRAGSGLFAGSRGTQKRDIDIPLDDPIDPAPAPQEGTKKSFFNRQSRVKRPDQILMDGEEQKEKTKKSPIEAVEIESAAPIHTEEAQDSGKTDESKFESAVQFRKPAPKDKEPIPEMIVPEQAITGSAGAAEYRFPPLTLLECDTSGGRVDGREEIQVNKERLEKTLQSFGINAVISSYTRGPSVTRYEMELEVGVKLNKLTNLADDIALSLGASGVRIAAIPNKLSTVGIEVPNKMISKVYLRDIIDSPTFKNASSKLTFAIGKNISGEAIVGNIAKLPHMLVAGTTGSGKSVCLNSLILSILYKATPDEVKFIMIDPKMVEFKIYNGIPHLLVPVVTEAKKAAGALQWAVTEMMKRYRLFSEVGARDLKTYNEYILKNGEEKTVPQIVVVIDELADLMLVAAKEVEESICRVAQMGRAAGVHLVIATQSPRKDVITGLMKANIPSRIALKVASALESRIILDAGGNADKLVGNGDMLYAPIGVTKPVRIQGTWVSDEERESIIEYIKSSSGEAEYAEDVINQIDRAASGENRGPITAATAGEESGDSDSPYSDCDELFTQAVDVILDSGQASVSMLQRRLKLGYSRAARLVDQMEEHGIVGPFEGSKPRQLLITKTQWQEMQFVQGTAPVDTVLPEADDFSLADEDDE